MVVLFLIVGMFSLELMNIVVEKVVDLVFFEYYILVKYVKDVVVVVVLVYVCFVVFIGGIIFLKYLF